jgi:hypothetical protein
MIRRLMTGNPTGTRGTQADTDSDRATRVADHLLQFQPPSFSPPRRNEIDSRNR